MIYVEILGRIGNQMFSYAFARKIQMENPSEWNHKIVLDFTNFVAVDQSWENSLKYYKCGDNLIEGKRRMSLLQKAILFLYFHLKEVTCKKGGPKQLCQFEKKWVDVLNLFGIFNCTFGYHKFRYKSLFKNKLVLGFYESPLYFKGIDQIIKKEFSLTNIEINIQVRQLINELEGRESVCVGIRRGDFVEQGLSICSINYYKKGVRYILDKIGGGGGHTYVFSDDIQWVKENISFDGTVSYVTEDNTILPQHVRLICMSKCKHFVISNSTYVWWAQHLSGNMDKIVVAPSIWRDRDRELHRDIYEDGWVLLDPYNGEILQ